VAFDPGRDAAANAHAVDEALRHVRTGAVAPAARDDGRGRFRAGDAVGFVGNEVIAWGEPETALRAVLGSLGEGAELVTCIRGRDAPLDDEVIPRLAPAGVEIECSEGGQPRYWWLISAE
jgi:dihydroxyacetone kinase-like predicted kinase